MIILLKNGLSKDDAQVIVDHLLDGELGGHPSHGFYRIPGIVNAVKKAGSPSEIRFEQETSNSALLNGSKRQGLVVALKAAEVAISKARVSNIVVVGAYNYAGTTGSMGYFTRRIANANLIGIMLANSEASTPAWGGMQPIFGTNPISISIPSNEEPIVIDLATSKWAYGDIALAIKEGRSIPEGIVLDKKGNPSTDPNDANYCMLPFGEHKGYALALAFEILAGPLVRAKAGAMAVPGSDGSLIIAINPSTFASIDQFKLQVSSLINEIKNSKRLPGVNELFYPGEQSQRNRVKNRHATHIDMVEQILEDVKALAADESSKVVGPSYY